MRWKGCTPGSEGGCIEKARIHMGYGTSLCSPPYPAKHQSTVTKMAARYKAKIETSHGLRTCFEARVHRDGKKDLVARFGGIPLLRNKNGFIADPVPVPVPTPRKELIHRLRTRQVRAMRAARARWLSTRSPSSPDSGHQDQVSPRGRPSWPGNRRKTLVVCHPCHEAIHATPVADAA